MYLIYIVLIVAGVFVDVVDLGLRFRGFLQRRRVPSAGMFLGYCLMVIGIHGLTVLAQPRATVFGWARWKTFWMLAGVALLLHLFIHLVLQYVLVMPINLRYRRRLFDMTELPRCDRGKAAPRGQADTRKGPAQPPTHESE